MIFFSVNRMIKSLLTSVSRFGSNRFLINCESVNFRDTMKSVRCAHEFGITTFIDYASNDDNSSFDGVKMKERYSDFLVNEIDTDENIVHLTDTVIPANHDDEIIGIDLKDEEMQLVADAERKIKEFCASDPGRNKWVDIAIPDDVNKEVRKHIHMMVKQIAQSTGKGLKSSTAEAKPNKRARVDGVDEPKHKVIRVTTVNDMSSSERWISSKGQYCTCVLYKENLDTFDCISRIGRILKIRRLANHLSYAGLKDKTGKTIQLVSFHKVLPSRLIAVNQADCSVKLGNFRFSEEPIKKCYGNYFTVVLRNFPKCENKKKIFEARISSLGQKGFVNYFGHQRFGSFEKASTDMIGHFLIKGAYEKAIDALLCLDGINDENVQSLIDYYHSENFEKSELKRRLQYIRKKTLQVHILDGISKCNRNDSLGILSEIPLKMRTLYIHAYQSKIWNNVASYRLNMMCSTLPLVGDIVKRGDDFVHLTEDYVNDYKIEDIYLPLPGFNIKYPENDVKSEYRRLICEVDEIEDICESFRSKFWQYDAPGSYRKVIEIADKPCVEFTNYEEGEDCLVESDWDKICGTNRKRLNDESKDVAAIVSFGLKTSSYATMALRQALRINLGFC